MFAAAKIFDDMHENSLLFATASNPFTILGGYSGACEIPRVYLTDIVSWRTAAQRRCAAELLGARRACEALRSREVLGCSAWSLKGKGVSEFFETLKKCVGSQGCRSWWGVLGKTLMHVIVIACCRPGAGFDTPTHAP